MLMQKIKHELCELGLVLNKIEQSEHDDFCSLFELSNLERDEFIHGVLTFSTAEQKELLESMLNSPAIAQAFGNKLSMWSQLNACEKVAVLNQVYSFLKRTPQLPSKKNDNSGKFSFVLTLPYKSSSLSCYLERSQPKKELNKVWQDFLQTRSESSRNVLMLHYLKDVKDTAELIWVNLPDKVDMDSLIQAGIFGLMDAIDTFDLDIGVQFESYCIPRIMESILNELRSMNWVPRYVRARHNLLHRAKKKFEENFGRIPSEEDLAKSLELDKVEFCRLQRDADGYEMFLTSNLKNAKHDEDIVHHVGFKEIRKGINVDCPQKRKRISPSQKKRMVNLVRNGLSQTEKLILFLYYRKEKTFNEISSTLEISELQVSQIHSSILDRLRGQRGFLENEETKALDEFIHNKG